MENAEKLDLRVLLWTKQCKKGTVHVPLRNPLSTSSDGNIPTCFVLMFCPFHQETSGLQCTIKEDIQNQQALPVLFLLNHASAHTCIHTSSSVSLSKHINYNFRTH